MRYRNIAVLILGLACLIEGKRSKKKKKASWKSEENPPFEEKAGEEDISKKFQCYYSATLRPTSFANLRNSNYPQITRGWDYCWYSIYAPRGSTVTMKCQEDTFRIPDPTSSCR